MNDAAVRGLVAEHATPLHLAFPTRLTRNLADLRQALRNDYPASDIAYSLKTNYLLGCVRAVAAEGHLIEVVSDHELAYILRCGIPLDRVVLNGPIKGPLALKLVTARSGLRVNADSVQHLAQWLGLGESAPPVGLRVAARQENGTVSRFGLDLAEPEVERAVRRAMDAGLNINGLHIHHSSQRSASSYVDRLDELVSVAQRLGLDDVAYFDVGGGMASRMPAEVRARLTYEVSTFEEYGAALGGRMRQHFPLCGPRLIVEPGIGMLADTMTYVSTVESVKQVGGVPTVVVDGSSLDINPLRSAVLPPCRLLGGSRTGGTAYRVMGATSMEVDVMGTLYADRSPEPGDLIVHENVGAYSISLQPHFIIPQPAVIDAETGVVLRPREELGAFLGGGS